MRRLTAFVAFALFLQMSAAGAADRAAADATCVPTDTALVYRCTLVVSERKTDEPVIAERIIVRADMPSMPMAHNVPPAEARPMPGMPGRFTVELALEMHGEWALALDVDGEGATSGRRVRDRVIVKKMFTGAGAAGGHGHRH